MSNAEDVYLGLYVCPNVQIEDEYHTVVTYSFFLFNRKTSILFISVHRNSLKSLRGYKSAKVCVCVWMYIERERVITTVTAVLPHTGTTLWTDTQRKYKFSFQEKWRKTAGKASRAPCWINPLTAGSRNKHWQYTASTFFSDWRLANTGVQ